MDNGESAHPLSPFIQDLMHDAHQEKDRPVRGRTSPSLPGSLDPQRDKLRFCTGPCQSDRPQAGGVETSPGRFRCANCWAGFQARMKSR